MTTKSTAKKGAAKKDAAKGKTATKKDTAKTKTAAKKGAAKTPAPKKEPAARDKFGFREGSLKSKAAALYAAGKGATLAEVKKAVGSSQLNLLKELEEKGYTIEKTKVEGDGKKQVTRYKIKDAKGGGASKKGKGKKTS